MNEGVTCFCPTYLRSPYPLEEALWCFLQQDYEGPKELFISNDDPDIELVFDHPDVTIVNHPKRFTTVYTKINEDRNNSKYEFIMNWADDDLFAPWAIKTALKHWKKNKNPFVCFHPHFKMHPNGYAHMRDILPGYTMVTKEVWKKCGGYPVEMMNDATQQIGNDRYIYHIIKLMGLYGQQKIPDDEIYYCWRFSKNFKWKRKSWSNQDKEKFKIKDRTPKVIKLEPKLSTDFAPFGFKDGNSQSSRSSRISDSWRRRKNKPKMLS